MTLRTQYEDMDIAEFVYKTKEEKFLEFMQRKQFVEILRKSDIKNFFIIYKLQILLEHHKNLI